MSVAALHAAARFGLGARPGELAAIGRDPRGWAADQFARAARRAPAPDAADAVAGLSGFLTALRKRDERAMAGAKASMRQGFVADIGALHRLRAETDLPAHERWVAFWTNHFTVSTKRPVLFAAAPGYAVEAIRPHVYGRFRALLGAVIRHPAMLVYLDNVQSFGPNSRLGRRRGRGLNENLARELLELHTLGVDGGYTQNDVTELAKILTGWSINGPRGRPFAGFAFQAPVHEPGPKTLLGARYDENGRAEGERALDALARHPATARHIARKLARHYVADEPAAAAVDRLAAVFQDTGGDLSALARTLVELDAAWADPGAKTRAPEDFFTAGLRAADIAPPGRAVIGALRALGQPPFGAPSPAGWPDTEADWLSGESLMRRIEFAEAAGRRLRRADPPALLETALGDAADPVTRFHAANAGARAEGVTVALANPQMIRR